MASTHTVAMTGGCPWGFRLYGGDGDPLLVAKLRKRSKADLAGMKEGDVLLSINNYSCRGISHGDAMTLVDNAGSSLNMDVLRGATAKAEIDAALVQAESRSQKVGPSALSAPCAPAAASSSLVNGVSSVPTDSQVSRKKETICDGNTTRHVTTETRTERFGGTTLTKVVREEVSETSSAAPPPQPRFQATPASRQPVPVWSPPGARTVTAPSGVKVEKNADDSFTMTIGLGGEGKENVAPKQPAPMFNVSKIVPGDKSRDAWQPSVPVAPRPQPEVVYQPPPPLATEAPDVDMEDGGPTEKPIPHPLHLSRILHEGSGSDECSSPGSPFTMAKKKLFSDSAFYDDPEHKYPTIEEQIKMARKVALSLTSPANVKARGHTMFVKRQERSEKWVTDENTTPRCIASSHFTFEDSSEDEKYYNPNPWKPKHTWQAPVIKPSPTSSVPPAPAMPPGMWQAPMLPHVSSKSEKASALSADEFERVRLYEQKSEHKTVSPQLCFNLASDLRNMKGKGGRLFAKRRAKSEKWVVDESPSPTTATAPTPELMKRLTAGISVPDGAESNNNMGEQPMETGGGGGGIPRNRLAEMIEMPKAKCSPWDAALESPYGGLARAFEHIDEYDSRVADALAKQQALAALPTAAANKNLGAPTSQSYAKGWSSTSTTNVESKDKNQTWSSTTSQSSYISSSTSQFPPSRAGFQPGDAPSASRYKPVQFNPGASQKGVPEQTQRPIGAQGGVCDL